MNFHQSQTGDRYQNPAESRHQDPQNQKRPQQDPQPQVLLQRDQDTQQLQTP